jgi:hypothetical protein
MAAKMLQMAGANGGGASAILGSGGKRCINDIPHVNLAAVVGRNIMPEQVLLKNNYQVSCGTVIFSVFERLNMACFATPI